MASTYDGAISSARIVEERAKEIAALARDLYWSTLEPSHNEGCDLEKECGAALLERIKERVEVLNDWVRALEESVNEHREHLASQEVE